METKMENSLAEWKQNGLSETLAILEKLEKALKKDETVNIDLWDTRKALAFIKVLKQNID